MFKNTTYRPYWNIGHVLQVTRNQCRMRYFKQHMHQMHGEQREVEQRYKNTNLFLLLKKKICINTGHFFFYYFFKPAMTCALNAKLMLLFFFNLHFKQSQHNMGNTFQLNYIYFLVIQNETIFKICNLVHISICKPPGR